MLPFSAVVPILVLVPLLAIASWVYADAKTLRDRGTPVVLITKFLIVDTPQMWALFCLISFSIVLPVYLAIRRQLR